MSRVLVTGGTGLIGAQLVPQLAERGHEVHVAARRDAAMPGAAAAHPCDLLEPDAADALVAAVRPTHLVHLAWGVVPGSGFWTSPDNARWVEASLALLRAFADAGGERAVGAGSVAEYTWAEGLCSESETPVAPDTLYGVSKAAVQAVGAEWAREVGLSFAWGRIFWNYGPGEHPTRLVASVITNLLQGRPAPTSHGRQRRDYLHVADVAGAFAALLDSTVVGPVNVATGEPVELSEVVGLAARLIGREDLLRLGEIESPPGEAPLVYADVGRLRDEVGFAPRYSLEQGLENTIEWWRRELRTAA